MDGGVNMKQPVVTIKEPNGYIRRAVLPYFLHEDADIEDTIVMVNFVRNMARAESGEGTVIDIEWMEEEEL